MMLNANPNSSSEPGSISESREETKAKILDEEKATKIETRSKRAKRSIGSKEEKVVETKEEDEEDNAPNHKANITLHTVPSTEEMLTNFLSDVSHCSISALGLRS